MPKQKPSKKKRPPTLYEYFTKKGTAEQRAEGERVLKNFLPRERERIRENFRRFDEVLSTGRQGADALLSLPDDQRAARLAQLDPRKGKDFFTVATLAKDAATSRDARRRGGKKRGQSKQAQGEETRRRIEQCEAALRKQGIRSSLNKRIAKELRLSTDYVRKTRKKRR